MPEDEREAYTRVSAIMTIGALVSWALYLGHNGIMLATGLAAIAGIAGYSLGRKAKMAVDRTEASVKGGNK